MVDFLILLILTFLWCYGVRTLFSEGFLLERVGDWAWEKSEFISKPLFQCPPCQSSIHGTIAYFIFFDGFLLWIPFCICLCGLNYLALKLLTE